MRDAYRNFVEKEMRRHQTKRNFHTYELCYISDDNMSELTGYRPYICCNFRFSYVIYLLLHLLNKPTHFVID